MSSLSLCIGRLLAFGCALPLVGCGSPREVPQRPLAGEPAPAVAPAPGKAPKQTFGKPVPLPKNKPLTYKDAETGILIYVESDRRHVAAIDKNGKVLWCKDPFLDAGLSPFPQKHPFIFSIGNVHSEWALKYLHEHVKKGNFIYMNFTTKEFGAMDEQNGDFISLGRD